MATAGEDGQTPAEIAPALTAHGHPVIVFCASHSGSRLLAQALSDLGVFMGARLNESRDSLDLFDFTRWLVERHVPGLDRLLALGDPELRARALATFEAHLQGRAPGQPWGWKLPETGHVLPVMRALFPGARLIHLVRDGRDVAFSPFVAPKDPFWRKIYFGNDGITRWRGLAMTQRAYRAHGHVFNAERWVRSVRLGRADGAAAGDRYLELRYEALAAAPQVEMERLAAVLGAPVPADVARSAEAHVRSIGKWRNEPASRLAEIRPILAPTLDAFGYDWPGGLDEREEAKVSAGRRTGPGGLGGLFRVRDRR